MTYGFGIEFVFNIPQMLHLEIFLYMSTKTLAIGFTNWALLLINLV